MKRIVIAVLALLSTGCSVAIVRTNVEADQGSTASVHVDPGQVTSSAEHTADVQATLPDASTSSAQAEATDKGSADSTDPADGTE